MRTLTTQVKIVLQGKVEPFHEYEYRLNNIIKEQEYQTDEERKSSRNAIIVIPSASADGRMCCVINKTTLSDDQD